MANVYYKIDGDICYYTNENKEGYTLRPASYGSSNDHTVIIELYNGKFIFPENANSLFNTSKNTEFNDMDKWDTSGCKYMGSTFYNCNQLTSIDLSHFNTSNVQNMASMFRNCTRITEMDVSGFNTSKVTDMSYMFNNCQRLTSLDLSSWNTSSVSSISNMFNGCNSLTSLDVSNFDISNVSNLNSLFRSCEHLTELDLSSFDTSAITSTQNTFYDCIRLVTIKVSKKWDLSNVTASTYMFANCSSIVGEAGTRFSSSKVDKTYAHVDYGENNPGYLTSGKGWWECVVYIKENDVWEPMELYV